MIKFWIDIKNRSWLQSTALGLLGALLFSIIAPPFAEANLWSERRKALEEMEKKKEPLQLASLAGLPIHQPSLLPSLETGLSPESMQQVMSKVQARAFSSFGKRSAKRDSLGLPSELVSRIEGFGDIERVYLTNNNQPKPLIILIQDAHGIYGAQKNIAQLIKEMTGMGVGLVGVEGSVGKMEGLEKWRRYQDKKILMGIAGYLLEQGLLTGVEVAGLATEPALEVKDKSQNPASSSSLPYIEYYGIEDKDKYLEQVSSFKQTLKSNKEVEEWKGQIAKEISDLKEEFYTDELKELDVAKNRYETAQISLGEWLEFLNNKASLSSNSQSQSQLQSISNFYSNFKSSSKSLYLSNVSKYLSAYKLEKEINFKKVSEEQKRLLEKLSHKLSKKELMGLLEESLAYRLGKIGYGEFYTGIKERCDKAELKINSELGKYISYVGKVEAIDRDRLFIEAKELEEQVWKNKINNSKSENLYAIDKDYRLLEKAINFKLSPEEWEEYDQRKVEIEKIAERIRGVAINTLTSGNLGRADKQVRELALNTTRGAQDLSLNKTVREVMRNVREFNRLSHERNHIFVEKLIARMIEKSSKEKNHPIGENREFKELGSNSSILVAGGYHSRGMEDLLRKKQISYITIRPSLNTAEISKDYHPLNAFKRDLLPLEKMFSREKVSIAFPQATGGIDPSVITPEESGVEGTLSVVTEGMKKIQEDKEVVATEDDGIRSKEVSNKEFLKDSREPSSHFRSLIVRKKVPYNGKSYTLFTLRKEDEKLSQRLLNDPKTELEDEELLDGAENLWAGQMKDPFTGEIGPTFAVAEESNLLLRARELFLPIAQQVNVMSSAFVKNQVKGFVYRKETLTKKQGLKWKKYLALPAYLASAGSTGQEWMVYIVLGIAAVVFLIDNRKSIFSFFVDLFRNLGIEKAVDEGVRKIKANVTTILAGDWKEKALALKFKDLRKEDTAIAGGKGANLGELENKGAPGRTGFVTTSKAFLEFLEKNNLERDGNTITLLQAIQEIILKVNVGDAIELNKASQEIQNLIRQKDLPLDLVAAIKQQYQELCDYYDVGDDLPVAVRSSGTREDLEEASSAGIQATYLHVQGIEEILMRVKDDYASLYLPRAISYRDQTLVNAFINKLEETKKHSFQAFLNKLRQSKDSYLAAFSERLENPSSRVPSLELRQVLDGALFKDEKELFNKVLPKYTDPAEVSMAVVIQAMMKNNRAFTIFSVDNRTGWSGLSLQKENLNNLNEGRVFRIELTHGLGEALVGGKTSPDSYLVHVFKGANGEKHVNILNKELGTKKIQVIRLHDALKQLNLTIEEIQILSKSLFLAIGGKGAPESGAAIRALFNRKQWNFEGTTRAFVDEMARLIKEPVSENTIVQKNGFFIGLEDKKLLVLAHVLRELRHDEHAKTVETFVPESMGTSFAATDEEIKQIALAALETTKFYGDIRDIEGGLVNGKPEFVQSRPYTAAKETDQPKIVNLKKRVVPQEAVDKAELEGNLLASGVKGRNAYTGRIVIIDEDGSLIEMMRAIDPSGQLIKELEGKVIDEKGKLLPLDHQIKTIQDMAEESRKTGENLVLVTRFTTPDYNDAIKVTKGIIAFEGGDTSHAAIVSRELGISSVVGIGAEIDRLKYQDPTRWEENLKVLLNLGSEVTVDANRGKVFKGKLPTEEEAVTIDIDKLPPLHFTKPGLIIASDNAMREVSKLGLYDSHYGVSLARAEFFLMEIGVHPLALEAYENLMHLDKVPNAMLHSDPEIHKLKMQNVEKLKSHPELIETIAERIQGYPSAKDFYVQKLSQGIASIAAANGISQKMLYRFTDFKQNELNKMVGGKEFGLKENATMIGHRGAGYLLDEENRITFGWELEAIKRAIAMGYSNIGVFYPFVRTPDELRRGLKRLNDLQVNSKSVGMMVELPSNVMQAEEFIKELALYGEKHSDTELFFSFGTNDLTQLTLRVGRDESKVATLFRESEESVIASIRHVAYAIHKAKKKFPNLKLSLGLCGQAIVKLANPDETGYNPQAAKEIISMLDSVGTDSLGYLRAVKLAAEAELEHSELSEHVLAEAVRTDKKIGDFKFLSGPEGVSSGRRLRVIRNEKDLDQVGIGETLFFPMGLKLPEDKLRAAIDLAGSVLVSQLLVEAGKNWQEMRSRMREKSSSSSAIEDFSITQELQKLDDMEGLFKQLDKLLIEVSHKPYGSVAEGLEPRLEDGKIYTIDFENKFILLGEIIPQKREPATPDILETPSVKTSPLVSLEQKPEASGVFEIEALQYHEYASQISREQKIVEERPKTVLVVKAAELYKQIGIHPLALLDYDSHNKGRLKDHPEILEKIAGVLEQAGIDESKKNKGKKYFRSELFKMMAEVLQKIKSPDQAVIYQTSDFTSADFKGLIGGALYEEEEANPPLGFGGLFRMISEEYQPILRWEAEVLEELYRSPSGIPEGMKPQLGIQFTDARLIQHLEKAVSLMRDWALQQHIQIGIRMDNPDNYIRAKDYMRHAQFFSVDVPILFQQYFAADITNKAIPVVKNMSKVQRALTPVIARISRFAAEAGVKEVEMAGKAGDRAPPLTVEITRNLMNILPIIIFPFAFVYAFLGKTQPADANPIESNIVQVVQQAQQSGQPILDQFFSSLSASFLNGGFYYLIAGAIFVFIILLLHPKTRRVLKLNLLSLLRFSRSLKNLIQKVFLNSALLLTGALSPAGFGGFPARNLAPKLGATHPELEELYKRQVEASSPEHIKRNRIFDITDKGQITVILKQEHLEPYSESNPEGLGLWKWLEDYEKEAKVATAGIRFSQNILYPWDTRFRVNLVGVALATLAKALVAKERYPNHQIEKTAGGEVRYNTPLYIDLIARIQAAQGIRTYLPTERQTIPVWMASFLTFMYDLAGAEYVTSSHAVSSFIATKDFDEEGSQYLPEESLRFVAKIREIFEIANQKGEYRFEIAASNDPLINTQLMEQLKDGTDLYVAYLKNGVATDVNLERIKSVQKKIIVDNVGGGFHRTASQIFEKLGINGSFEWFRVKEDSFFHGIGKELRADGKVYDYSQDTTIIKRDKETGRVLSIPVMERMGYDTLLKEKAVGTVVLMVDPDGDRLVTAQIEPSNKAEFLSKIGIDYLILDEDRILALYTPNQSFFLTMVYQAEALKEAGLWENHPRFLIMTTASSLAWREWAEKNGIHVLNVPVGFKEIAAMQRKIESQIKSNPNESVIVKDVFDREVNLGVQPRMLIAGEESGGAVMGPEELIQSLHGRIAIGMREKSDGEMLIIQSAMAANLESKNMFLSDYLNQVFDQYEIKGRFDVREDVVYYNQNETDPELLKKEKEEGEARRTKNYLFYLSMALAYRDGQLGKEEIIAILNDAFGEEGLNFDDLKEIYFVGDGVFFQFPNKVLEIRPSGTDAKSKSYAMGDNKAELTRYAIVLGNYSGELTPLHSQYVPQEYVTNGMEIQWNYYQDYYRQGLPPKDYVPPAAIALLAWGLAALLFGFDPSAALAQGTEALSSQSVPAWIPVLITSYWLMLIYPIFLIFSFIVFEDIYTFKYDTGKVDEEISYRRLKKEIKINELRERRLGKTIVEGITFKKIFFKRFFVIVAILSYFGMSAFLFFQTLADLHWISHSNIPLPILLVIPALFLFFGLLPAAYKIFNYKNIKKLDDQLIKEISLIGDSKERIDKFVEAFMYPILLKDYDKVMAALKKSGTSDQELIEFNYRLLDIRWDSKIETRAIKYLRSMPQVDKKELELTIAELKAERETYRQEDRQEENPKNDLDLIVLLSNAETENDVGTLAAMLSHKNKAVVKAAADVLIKIGERNPGLIADSIVWISRFWPGGYRQIVIDILDIFKTTEVIPLVLERLEPQRADLIHKEVQRLISKSRSFKLTALQKILGTAFQLPLLGALAMGGGASGGGSMGAGGTGDIPKDSKRFIPQIRDRVGFSSLEEILSYMVVFDGPDQKMIEEALAQDRVPPLQPHLAAEIVRVFGIEPAQYDLSDPSSLVALNSQLEALPQNLNFEQIGAISDIVIGENGRRQVIDALRVLFLEKGEDKNLDETTQQRVDEARSLLYWFAGLLPEYLYHIKKLLPSILGNEGDVNLVEMAYLGRILDEILPKGGSAQKLKLYFSEQDQRRIIHNVGRKDWDDFGPHDSIFPAIALSIGLPLAAYRIFSAGAAAAYDGKYNPSWLDLLAQNWLLALVAGGIVIAVLLARSKNVRRVFMFGLAASISLLVVFGLPILTPAAFSMSLDAAFSIQETSTVFEVLSWEWITNNFHIAILPFIFTFILTSPILFFGIWGNSQNGNYSVLVRLRALRNMEKEIKSFQHNYHKKIKRFNISKETIENIIAIPLMFLIIALVVMMIGFYIGIVLSMPDEFVSRNETLSSKSIIVKSLIAIFPTMIYILGASMFWMCIILVIASFSIGIRKTMLFFKDRKNIPDLLIGEINKLEPFEMVKRYQDLLSSGLFYQIGMGIGDVLNRSRLDRKGNIDVSLRLLESPIDEVRTDALKYLSLSNVSKDQLALKLIEVLGRILPGGFAMMILNHLKELQPSVDAGKAIEKISVILAETSNETNQSSFDFRHSYLIHVLFLFSGRGLDHKIRDILLADLESGIPARRARAASALADYPSSQVIERLIAHFEDTDSESRVIGTVSENAMIAFEEISKKNPDLISSRFDLIRSHLPALLQNPRVNGAPLIRVLQNIDGPNALETLIKLSKEVRNHNLVFIVDGLTQVQDSKVVEPLINVLDFFWSDKLRYSIEFGKTVAALGNLRDQRATEPLIGFLNQGFQVGFYMLTPVIVALGRIGDPRAIKPLLRMLKSSTVSSDALNSLKLIGGEEVLAGLQASLKEVPPTYSYDVSFTDSEGYPQEGGHFTEPNPLYHSIADTIIALGGKIEEEPRSREGQWFMKVLGHLKKMILPGASLTLFAIALHESPPSAKGFETLSWLSQIDPIYLTLILISFGTFVLFYIFNKNLRKAVNNKLNQFTNLGAIFGSGSLLGRAIRVPLLGMLAVGGGAGAGGFSGKMGGGLGSSAKKPRGKKVKLTVHLENLLEKQGTEQQDALAALLEALHATKETDLKQVENLLDKIARLPDAVWSDAELGALIKKILADSLSSRNRFLSKKIEELINKIISEQTIRRNRRITESFLSIAKNLVEQKRLQDELANSVAAALGLSEIMDPLETGNQPEDLDSLVAQYLKDHPSLDQERPPHRTQEEFLRWLQGYVRENRALIPWFNSLGLGEIREDLAQEQGTAHPVTLDELKPYLDRIAPERIETQIFIPGEAPHPGITISVLQEKEIAELDPEIQSAWNKHYVVFKIENKLLDYVAYIAFQGLREFEIENEKLKGHWGAIGPTSFLELEEPQKNGLIHALRGSSEATAFSAAAGLNIFGAQGIIGVRPGSLATQNSKDGKNRRRNILEHYALALNYINVRLGGGFFTYPGIEPFKKDLGILESKSPDSILPSNQTYYSAIGLKSASEALLSQVFSSRSSNLEGKVARIQGLDPTQSLLIPELLRNGAKVVVSYKDDLEFKAFKKSFPHYFKDKSYAEVLYVFKEEDFSFDLLGNIPLAVRQEMKIAAVDLAILSSDLTLELDDTAFTNLRLAGVRGIIGPRNDFEDKNKISEKLNGFILDHHEKQSDRIRMIYVPGSLAYAGSQVAATKPEKDARSQVDYVDSVIYLRTVELLKKADFQYRTPLEIIKKEFEKFLTLQTGNVPWLRRFLSGSPFMSWIATLFAGSEVLEKVWEITKMALKIVTLGAVMGFTPPFGMADSSKPERVLDPATNTYLHKNRFNSEQEVMARLSVDVVYQAIPEGVEKEKLRSYFEDFAYDAVLNDNPKLKNYIQTIIPWLAQNYGVKPSTLKEHYKRMANGEIAFKTVPAIGLGLSGLLSARAAFRASQESNVNALVFQLSDFGGVNGIVVEPQAFTSEVLSAAVLEKHDASVYLKLNLKVNAEEYQRNQEREIKRVKLLIENALASGFKELELDTLGTSFLWDSDMISMYAHLIEYARKKAVELQDADELVIGLHVPSRDLSEIFISENDIAREFNRVSLFLAKLKKELDVKGIPLPELLNFDIALDLDLDRSEIKDRLRFELIAPIYSYIQKGWNPSTLVSVRFRESLEDKAFVEPLEENLDSLSSHRIAQVDLEALVQLETLQFNEDEEKDAASWALSEIVLKRAQALFEAFGAAFRDMGFARDGRRDAWVALSGDIVIAKLFRNLIPQKANDLGDFLESKFLKYFSLLAVRLSAIGIALLLLGFDPSAALAGNEYNPTWLDLAAQYGPFVLVAAGIIIGMLFFLNKNFREGVIRSLENFTAPHTVFGQAIRLPLLGALAMGGGGFGVSGKKNKRRKGAGTDGDGKSEKGGKLKSPLSLKEAQEIQVNTSEDEMEIRAIFKRLNAEGLANGSLVWMKSWRKWVTRAPKVQGLSNIFFPQGRGQIIETYVRATYSKRDKSWGIAADIVKGYSKDSGLTFETPIRLDGGTGLFIFYTNGELEISNYKGRYKVKTERNPLINLEFKEGQTSLLSIYFEKDVLEALKAQGLDQFVYGIDVEGRSLPFTIAILGGEKPMTMNQTKTEVDGKVIQALPQVGQVLSSFTLFGAAIKAALLSLIVNQNFRNIVLRNLEKLVGPRTFFGRVIRVPLLGALAMGGGAPLDNLAPKHPLLPIFLMKLRHLSNRVFGEVFPYDQVKVVDELLEILNRDDLPFEWEQTRIDSLVKGEMIGKALVPVKQISGQEPFEYISLRDQSIMIQRAQKNGYVNIYRKIEDGTPNGRWELGQVIGSANSANNHQPYYLVRDSNLAVGLDNNLVKIFEISHFLRHTENKIFVLETDQYLTINELPLKGIEVLRLKGSKHGSRQGSMIQPLAALGVENQDIYLNLLSAYISGLSTIQIAAKSSVKEYIIKAFLARTLVPTKSDLRQIENFNSQALRDLNLQTVTRDDRALMKELKKLYSFLGYDRARSRVAAIEMNISQDVLSKILEGTYQGPRLVLVRALASLKSRAAMPLQIPSRYMGNDQLTVSVLHRVADIRRETAHKITNAQRSHELLRKERDAAQGKYSFLSPHKELYSKKEQIKVKVKEIRGGDWKVTAPIQMDEKRLELARGVISDASQLISDLELGIERWIFNIETISDLSEIWKAITLLSDKMEKFPTIIIQPRGLMELVELDDYKVPAGLLDAVAYLFNNLKNLKKLGMVPTLSLQIETVEEALFWNSALAQIENFLNLDKGSVKVFLPVNSLETLFELEEILWVLRERVHALTLGEKIFNPTAILRIEKVSQKRGVFFIHDFSLKSRDESEDVNDYSEEAGNKLNEMSKGISLKEKELIQGIKDAVETLYVHLGGDVRGNSFTLLDIDQIEILALEWWNLVHGSEKHKNDHYLNLFSDTLIKKYQEMEVRLELTSGKVLPEIGDHLKLATAILQHAIVHNQSFIPVSQMIEIVASDIKNPNRALESMVRFAEFFILPKIRRYTAAAKVRLWNSSFKAHFLKGEPPKVKVDIEAQDQTLSPSGLTILPQIGGFPIGWLILPIGLKLEILNNMQNFTFWVATHPVFMLLGGVLLVGALVLAVKAWSKQLKSEEKIFEEIAQLAALNNVALAKSKLEKRLAKANKRNERALFLGALHAMGGDVSKGFERDYKSSIVEIINENAPVRPVLQAYAEEHIGFRRIIIKKNISEKVINIEDARKDKEYEEKFRMGYSAVQMALVPMEQRLDKEIFGVAGLNANGTKVIVAGNDGRYSLAMMSYQLDQIKNSSERKIVLTGNKKNIERLVKALDEDKKKILNGKQVKTIPEASGRGGRVHAGRLYKKLIKIGWAQNVELLSENPKMEIEESLYHSMWITIYKIMEDMEVQRVKGMKEAMEDNKIRRLIEIQA